MKIALIEYLGIIYMFVVEMESVGNSRWERQEGQEEWKGTGQCLACWYLLKDIKKKFMCAE